MKTFKIKTPKGERIVGPGNPAFIIAEMSGNHNQDYDRAVDIVKSAADAGADAIKLQTYTADTMTINSKKPWFMERSSDNPDNWKGESLYELYQKAYTPWEWHSKLQKIAHKLGLVFFSAPFDDTSIDFLESLDVPCYKIAAYEAVDVLLLRKVAKTKKPIIMSVGFSTKEEVSLAVETLRSNGNNDIALLHCLTTYADEADVASANLRTILDLRDRFNVIAGFSDNNAGVEIPFIATLLGASVLEKHITIDRASGVDARFSLVPEEFKKLVNSIRRAELATGKVFYGPRDEKEKDNFKYRRSLFVSKDVKKGEKFSSQNVRSIRPGHGLPPKYYDEIIGRVAKKDIEEGTPLGWKLIDNI